MTKMTKVYRLYYIDFYGTLSPVLKFSQGDRELTGFDVKVEIYEFPTFEEAENALTNDKANIVGPFLLDIIIVPIYKK